MNKKENYWQEIRNFIKLLNINKTCASIKETDKKGSKMQIRRIPLSGMFKCYN
jgi:hypothetical protein